MSKRWRKVEITYLKRHANESSLDELAERFHTDTSTVLEKLKELRLVDSGGGDQEAVLVRYEAALACLYEEKWERAADELEAVAAVSDRAALAARARRLAVVARSRLVPESDEAVDPYLAAVAAKNRGHLEVALAACEADGRSEREARFAYLAAAVGALRGQLDVAAEHLERASALDSRHRLLAASDPDFRSLREAGRLGTAPADG